MRYNHALDIAFEVISNKEDGSDITNDMLRTALTKRIKMIDDCDLIEACGAPFDTYEMDD